MCGKRPSVAADAEHGRNAPHKGRADVWATPRRRADLPHARPAKARPRRRTLGRIARSPSRCDPARMSCAQTRRRAKFPPACRRAAAPAPRAPLCASHEAVAQRVLRPNGRPARPARPAPRRRHSRLGSREGTRPSFAISRAPPGQPVDPKTAELWAGPPRQAALAGQAYAPAPSPKGQGSGSRMRRGGGRSRSAIEGLNPGQPAPPRGSFQP